MIKAIPYLTNLDEEETNLVEEEVNTTDDHLIYTPFTFYCIIFNEGVPM